MNSGVYRIDLGNGWFYVGSSSDLRRRKRDHRRELVSGSHRNRIMQNVYAKHGVFTFTVIGHYPVDEIIAREQVLLDLHHSDPRCANNLPTAGNSLGVKRSAETCARMSAAASKMSAETRAKISAAATGRRLSPETRAKLSAARSNSSPETRARQSAAKLGRKRSAEACANISAGLMGREVSPETRAKMSASAKAWRARKKMAAGVVDVIINAGRLCQCGCGALAPIAKRNDPRLGHTTGQSVRFVRGHNIRAQRCKP